MLPLFRRGIEGQSETLVFFELSDVSFPDVEAFDAYLGLRPADIVTVTPYGDPGLTGALDEADLDVEWAHVMAPYARTVVYAYSELSGLFGGLSLATIAAMHSGDAAISISYGERNIAWGHLATDIVFADAAHHGLGIFAGSGDHGQAGLPNWSWPSTDLDVVSVGGLEYDTSGHASYWYEGYSGGKLWAGGYGKTLGIAPSWQRSLGMSNLRLIPDVSELANDAFMVAKGSITVGGGTSLTSPIWAAVWALVTQDYGQQHNGARVPVPAGETIYTAASFPGPPAFHQAFDARTGFGAPDVANLAADINAAYPYP